MIKFSLKKTIPKNLKLSRYYFSTSKITNGSSFNDINIIDKLSKVRVPEFQPITNDAKNITNNTKINDSSVNLKRLSFLKSIRNCWGNSPTFSIQ